MTIEKTIIEQGPFPERVKRPLLFCVSDSFSGTHPGKEREMNEEKVLHYLKIFCAGKNGVKTGAEIQRATGVSEKTLRSCVNRMRRKGIPIGSNQSGYFYALTAGEIYATIRFLKSLVKSILAAIEGLERSLDGFSGEDL